MKPSRAWGDMEGWNDEEEDEFLFKASQIMEHINEDYTNNHGHNVGLDDVELAEMTRLAAEGDADWWDDDHNNNNADGINDLHKSDDSNNDSQRFHQTDIVFNNNVHNVLDYDHPSTSSAIESAMAPPPPKRQCTAYNQNLRKEEDMRKELERLRSENQRIRDEHYRQLGEAMSLREDQRRLKAALAKEQMDREREVTLKKEELRHLESKLNASLDLQKTENEFLLQELKQTRDLKTQKKTALQSQQLCSNANEFNSTFLGHIAPPLPKKVVPASIDKSLLSRRSVGKHSLTKETETQTTTRAKRQLRLHLRCVANMAGFEKDLQGTENSGDENVHPIHFCPPSNVGRINEVINQALSDRENADFECLEWLCYSLQKQSKLEDVDITALLKESKSDVSKYWLLRLVLTAARSDLIAETTLHSFIQSTVIQLINGTIDGDLDVVTMMIEVSTVVVSSYGPLNCHQGHCDQEGIAKLVLVLLDRHKWPQCSRLLLSFFDYCLQLVATEALFSSKCHKCLPIIFLSVSQALKMVLETHMRQPENNTASDLPALRSGTLLLFHCCSRRRKQIANALMSSGSIQRHSWVVRAVTKLKPLLNLNDSFVDVFAELSMDNSQEVDDNQ